MITYYPEAGDAVDVECVESLAGVIVYVQSKVTKVELEESGFIVHFLLKNRDYGCALKFCKWDDEYSRWQIKEKDSKHYERKSPFFGMI